MKLFKIPPLLIIPAVLLVNFGACLQAEEGREGYEEALESAGDILVEYLEIKGEEDEEVAEAFLDDNTPLGNLFVRMLQEMGMETDAFNTSSGVLRW
ncbi:hypothetical protein OAE39_02490 [Akkermansiaceae bacterium]|nr:hypothetical protein [Akkermansiaceae bacterium]